MNTISRWAAAAAASLSVSVIVLAQAPALDLGARRVGADSTPIDNR
jgi:hypothetical protein